MIYNKIFLLLCVLFLFQSCDRDEKTKSDSIINNENEDSFIGSYENYETGEVVLKLHQRDKKLFAFHPDSNYDGLGDFNGNFEIKVEKININDSTQMSHCGGIIKVLHFGIGGKDWRSNFKGGMIIPDRNNAILIKNNKGFKNDFHNYKSDYSLIIGNNSCFSQGVKRINLIKR